jgi:hypothetical protein
VDYTPKTGRASPRAGRAEPRALDHAPDGREPPGRVDEDGRPHIVRDVRLAVPDDAREQQQSGRGHMHGEGKTLHVVHFDGAHARVRAAVGRVGPVRLPHHPVHEVQVEGGHLGFRDVPHQRAGV